jgi:hypothetical protein
VGAVLEGTADDHSAVCLHLFNDDAEAVELFLREQGIPVETQARHLRFASGDQAEYPVMLFSADKLPFDITVLPRDALRQAPLDRIDEKPMQRASLTQVEMLLMEESQVDNALEQKLGTALR